MFSALKKKHSPNPSTSEAAASGLTSSWVNQQLQNWRSPQQPHVRPWSAHPPIVQAQSPFLRNAYALSTTATPTGELFLFGGFVHRSKSPSNELYMFSTQDFSTTLLQTSGDVPSPRYGHRAVLSSTTLLIWGGRTDFSDQNARHQSNDDSFYLLNLGTSDLFDVKTAPADQNFLRSSIAKVDPHHGPWSRARRSLLPHHEVGRF
jgi:hypothetical protein